MKKQEKNVVRIHDNIIEIKEVKWYIYTLLKLKRLSHIFKLLQN